MTQHIWLQTAHPEWQPLLSEALQQVDSDYLKQLTTTNHWLPGAHLFAAFQLPLSSTRFILLGESPYPRSQSANGLAFWDNAVGSLWSSTGLSKPVNRATSLRNLIKMLLHARGDLAHDFSQQAIATLNNAAYTQTASDLFGNLLKKGFLLLNASLVYSEGQVDYHARQWRPFMSHLLTRLATHTPQLQLVLFGRIAKQIPEAAQFPCLIAEHPYNLSFITNPTVLNFFKPMDLLAKHD